MPVGTTVTTWCEIDQCVEVFFWLILTSHLLSDAFVKWQECFLFIF